MKNPNASKFIGILALAFLYTGPAQAGPGTPEFWNTDKVTIGLSDNYKLGFEQEFRFAEGDMHYEHSDAGSSAKSSVDSRLHYATATS